MPMKARLARIAVRLERSFDSLKTPATPQDMRIDPYIGYATPDHMILRGRVLSRALDAAQPEMKDDPTLWDNFRAMAALFNSKEVEGVKLEAKGVRTKTDEEGYFSLALPRPEVASGWETVVISGEHGLSRKLPVLVVKPEAEYGIISDIDDTVMKTDAWSLRRNLWNSMTGNARSRYVFPDAVALLEQLHAERNPVFYVSSSPWNLHGFLAEIFDRAGLVRGPKFLRDLGISSTKFVTGTHGDHKGEAIDTILAANPELDFILIGDTGQHDPHVYHDAIQRHPGRIREVILRTPGPGASKTNLAWIEKIKSGGTPVFAGQDYTSLLD
jgi:phosphatidate phosphatase APP1